MFKNSQQWPVRNIGFPLRRFPKYLTECLLKYYNYPKYHTGSEHNSQRAIKQKFCTIFFFDNSYMHTIKYDDIHTWFPCTNISHISHTQHVPLLNSCPLLYFNNCENFIYLYEILYLHHCHPSPSNYFMFTHFLTYSLIISQLLLNN